MPVPGVGSDRDRSSLPRELSGPHPFPLPRWARRGSATGYALLVSAAAGGAGFRFLQRAPVLALIPLALAIAGAGLLWHRRRMRRLLETGDPVVGRVDRTLAASGTLQVQYSVDVPAGGALRGRFVYDVGNVVRDFGLWPEPGDRVFLVVDPGKPTRRAVWGFAPPPGRAPRAPPIRHTPLPMGVVVAVVGAAIVVAGGVLAWIGLRS